MLPACLSPHKIDKSGKIRSQTKKKSSKKKRKQIAGKMSKTLLGNMDRKMERHMWRKLLKKRDAGGPNFDTMDWYRKNILFPAPKVKKRKKKKEEELPPITLKPVTPMSSTPWDTRGGKRKRPVPDSLLSVPTNLGMTGYNELMTGFETFEEKMQMLFTQTMARKVSKEFLVDVLNQDKRRRAAAARQIIIDAENDRKVQKALRRLKNKELCHCWETWHELWSLKKRLKRLANRVMGGTNSHTMQVWKAFVRECHIEHRNMRRIEEARLFPFAQTIQALARGVLTRAFLKRDRAARVIQRMVRAWHAKNMLKRAKAHIAKEEALLRKVTLLMKHGKLVRIFHAYKAYVKKITSIRAFVLKHMSGTKRACLHGLRTYARREILSRQTHAASVIQRNFRIYCARCILSRMRTKHADQEARVRRLLLHITHGAMIRTFNGWVGEYKKQRKFRRMMRGSINARVEHFYTTWRENSTFLRRRRELVKRLFLGAEKMCFLAWQQYHIEWQDFKSGEAMNIQCWWRAVVANQRVAELRKERDILLEAERQRDLYAQEESWRHDEMTIQDTEKTDRYRLISKEIDLAACHCVGLFHSKILYGSFDMRREGHIVMANLKEELVKENAFIVQRRDAEAAWAELSNKIETIRFYKETPDEKLAHEMISVSQRSDHFPERTLPKVGETIIWQGSLSENFTEDLRSTVKEWLFMKNQGWISHVQFIQWVAKGLMENLDSFEKRETTWQVLKSDLDENTVAEVIVAFQNNVMMKKLKIPNQESIFKYCKTGLDVIRGEDPVTTEEEGEQF